MKVGNRDVFRTLSNVYDGAFWGQICRGPSVKYLRRIFRKTNISNPLICKGVRNVIFSENFAYVLNDSKYVSLECCI